ncbi:MAG: hypothetical protein AB1631_03645 [Acidobacteriota bacterium]
MTTQEKLILETLRSVTGFVEPSGRHSWKLALANGKMVPATARATDGWLLFDAPLDGIDDRGDLWSLLALNARLSGGAKFALAGCHTRLRAEIVLDDEIDAAARLTETCAALKEALSLKEGLREDGPPRLSINAKDTRASLPPLCSQAGWAFTERDEGRLAVNLEARNGFHQALIEESRGGVAITTEIARMKNLSPCSRQSIGALLLRASAGLRMIRASVEESEEASIRFEARFDSLPGAVEIDRALAALSLACAMCARETRALEDDFLARRYLAAGRLPESGSAM